MIALNARSRSTAAALPTWRRRSSRARPPRGVVRAGRVGGDRIARRRPSADAPGRSFVARLLAPDLGRLLGQHLALVFGSVALAVLVGVPLGIWAFLQPRLAGALMGAVGVMQTCRRSR